jgi:glycosyltransferase involved in cell wall biosynthesis
VAEQRWDAERLTHLIIDDASSDDTVERIGRWLERERPAHRIERIDNRENLGGCANYALGFRRAPPDSIVLQLDGDDWLSDPLVLPYLDMVYHDPEVWMTYNTWMFPDGTPSNNSAPLPRRVIEDNAFREHGWVSSHLHSFRAELFSHVRDESLVDPETGELWRSAVDQACYLPMLELSGLHARHLERVTYVYNFRPESVYYARRDDQVKSDQRIRKLPRYRPLSAL